MAKATAICKCRKCGKEFTKITVKASRKEADAWEVWAKENYTLCSDCYRASREEGLPELTGTERQIAWAKSLRREFIDKYDSIPQTEDGKPFKEFFLGRHTDSKFWIDKREDITDMGKMISDDWAVYMDAK